MLSKKLFVFLILLLLIITCSSCEKNSTNKVGSNSGSEVSQDVLVDESTDHHGDDESIQTEFDAKTGILTVGGAETIDGLYSEGINKKIKKIIIREGVYEISNSFNGLTKVKKIEFPSTLANVLSSFNEAGSLESLALESNVLYLESSFNSCEKLRKLQFEGGINLIDSFYGCAVEKVHLPKFSKCEGSFADCNEIKEIAIEANVIVRENSVKIDNGWGEGEGDADDWVVTLSFECPDIKEIPRVYICQPKDTVDLGLKEYYWLYIPEGKSWKSYRSAPMELAVSN